MSLLPWKKSQQQKQLSAYHAGALDPQETLGLGEHLVFDHELRKTLADYARADEIVGQALAPATSPDAAQFADGLAASLGTEAQTPQAPRRINPAVWASGGLLVTAGLTFAGLRRRGLV